MSRVDFIECDDLLPFQDRMYFGPSALGAVDDYRNRAARFGKCVSGPTCNAGWAIWLSLIESEGAMPRRYGDGRLVQTIAPIARWVQLVESFPETRRLRVRYFGQAIADRYGRDLTGQDVTEFNGLDIEENWRRWAPMIEEGRPCYVVLNYGMIERRHVTVNAINLPIMDLERTRVRYVATVLHYPVPSLTD